MSLHQRRSSEHAYHICVVIRQRFRRLEWTARATRPVRQLLENPMDLVRHFEATEEALLAYAKGAGILGSPLGMGRAREALLSGFFKDHLPPRITVEQGELIDSAGGSSGETDVILVDHESPVFRVGSEAVVPVEAAPAVMEIKSNLTKGNLEDAVRKIASAKRLERVKGNGFWSDHDTTEYRVPSPPRRAMGYIVSYDGPAWDTMLGHVVDNPDWYDDDYFAFGPELICVLGRGFAYKNDNLIFAVPEGGEDWAVVKREDSSGLQALVAHLSETLGRFGQLSYSFLPYFETGQRADPAV